jgi:hypothetical protein
MGTIVLQLLMLAVVAYLVLHLVQPAAWHGSRARGLIWAGAPRRRGPPDAPGPTLRCNNPASRSSEKRAQQTPGYCWRTLSLYLSVP